MKTLHKLLLLAAASCGALVSSSRAQLVTYETVSSYNGSGLAGFGSGTARFETFTNIEAISSLTYNFFKSGVSSTTSTFNATFSEWTGASWSTVQNFGSFVVPDSSSWSSLTNGNGTFATHAQTFNFGTLLVTDPLKTYGLILTNTGAATNFGIGVVSNAFAYGSTGIFETNDDYTFSQIVVVPGGNFVPVTPVPEPATVASMLGATLVAGLVGLRVRQRRQLAPLGAVTVA